MLKQSLWLLLVASISINGYAQDPNAQKFAEQITAKIAKKHLSILASDKFEGRETGKRGAEMAAAYIANEFKQLKLVAPVNGSYIQNVPLTETSFEVTKDSNTKRILRQITLRLGDTVKAEKYK